MGFWTLKRHSAPLPQPTSSRDGGRSSKQRITTTSSDHGHDDDGDDYDEDDHEVRRHSHQPRQPRRFMLFPWQRRVVQKHSRAAPKSWSQSESEDLSPENSPTEYKQHRGGGGADGRRPFLRNSQRQRNSQDFADEEDEDEEDDDYADDQVHDPRYRLEPPVKGNASMTSYAAASADVTKSFTLSTSSQSTSDTAQNSGRIPQQPLRSKLYTPMDSHATGADAEAYQTRIIHPIIHKRDIFIDTSRTPDAYQQQQHRNIHNNNNNNNNNRNTINNMARQQQTSYQHNTRPDPDALIDILTERTSRHTNNMVKRPDPIEDMSFPTPKSHYSPGSFTSPRTTTSFNLPSYSVTGSMIYNAREQYGVESRAMKPGRGAKVPFKPTSVPSNSILASMLFRTSQLDEQPQSEYPQQQQPRGGHLHHQHHHQRLPPSYGGAARKEDEDGDEHHRSQASSPRSEVDGYEYEDDEDEEVIEVQHVENPYRQDPDGKLNSAVRTKDRQQPPAYKEPEEEFDPRQYYSDHYHPEDFMNVPDDIIHPQGSGVSSVSSVTDMWATVVDHHWNHANSRMIDLLENAMQEKFPNNGQSKRQPSSNQARKPNHQQQQQQQQRFNNGNNAVKNSSNNNKLGNLYEA